MATGKNIFSILGDSPFESLEEHITVGHKSVFLLKGLFVAVINSEWEKVTKINSEISDIESNADQLKLAMRLKLHKDLFLPVPRGEILGLLKAQDKIPNLAEDVAGLVLGRHIVIPQSIQADFIDLVDQVIQTCDQAKDSVHELSQFFLSGFSTNVSDFLEKMLNKLAKMEHIADTCEVKVRESLQSCEKQMDPVEVMFLYKIIGLIGAIADAAESVGDRLSLLLAQ